MDELVKEDVRVELADIGEGWSGDYNETDPEDERLLRFYVQRRVGDEWEDVDDASYCTALPAMITEEEKANALEFLMEAFYWPVQMEVSVKKLAERMSWINPEWLTVARSK